MATIEQSQQALNAEFGDAAPLIQVTTGGRGSSAWKRQMLYRPAAGDVVGRTLDVYLAGNASKESWIAEARKALDLWASLDNRDALEAAHAEGLHGPRSGDVHEGCPGCAKVLHEMANERLVADWRYKNALDQMRAVPAQLRAMADDMDRRIAYYERDAMGVSDVVSETEIERLASTMIEMLVRLPGQARIDLLIKYSAQVADVVRGHSEPRS